MVNQNKIVNNIISEGLEWKLKTTDEFYASCWIYSINVTKGWLKITFNSYTYFELLKASNLDKLVKHIKKAISEQINHDKKMFNEVFLK